MPPMADAAAYLPRRFRFVVFDWDGTLADSTAIIADALQQACRDIGAPVPDDVNARYVIGLGLADALRHVAPDLPRERHPDLVARYRHHYLAREAAISLFAGVREMLAELGAAGIVLGVATGKSRTGLDHALAQHGIGGFFAATRCADEGFSKPHPDMLLRLMDQVGAVPGETLMIGDTTHDLLLAQNAGVAGLAVGYGAHAPAGLAQLRPLATVQSIPDLRAWLRGNACLSTSSRLKPPSG
jgi:phosphoglycolate phosphatase